MRLQGVEYAMDQWPAMVQTRYSELGVETVRRIAVRAATDGFLSKRQALHLIRTALAEMGASAR